MSLINDTTESSGAQRLVNALETAGVKVVFAYPGSTATDVLQCLSHSPIRVVMPRHEQGGAFAADGYARRSGTVGVCLTSSGPGATNLVTGIADAYMDSIPLVAITCQVKQHLIGKNAFQETDIIGVTRPCVKHSYLILRSDEIPVIVADAFYLATHGRPGPVVIDIPIDVLQDKTASATRPSPLQTTLPAQARALPALPDEEALSKLYGLLRKCRRPCIYAGGGVISANASHLLRQVAEKFRIPVTTSLMGKGAFPDTHDLSLNFLGMHGSYAANIAVDDCDLLLAICVRFSDRVTGDIRRFAPKATIVHVDIDPSEINKNKHADMAFVCDAGDFLKAMLQQPFACDTAEWLDRIAALKQEHPFCCSDCTGPIQVPEVIQALTEKSRGNATIVTGVGQHQMWTAQFYPFSEPRQLLTSGGLGAMGFGLPAAIGAAIASGDNAAPVILLDGDGSFQMNIQELATVFCEELPIKMVILNNGNLGMVAQWEDRFFRGQHAKTDLRLPGQAPYPDFCTIAKGYGIASMRVTRREELPDAIDELLGTPGAYLLDVQVVHQRHVLPMIPAGGSCENIILS